MMNDNRMAVERTADELRKNMLNFKQKLIKARVLHKALTPIERGIVFLASKPEFKLTSDMLCKTVSAILAKMSKWLVPSFIFKASLIGREKALSNVRTASLMGNHSARTWSSDRTYVLLLGINELQFRFSSGGSFIKS